VSIYVRARATARGARGSQHDPTKKVKRAVGGGTRVRDGSFQERAGEAAATKALREASGSDASRRDC